MSSDAKEHIRDNIFLWFSVALRPQRRVGLLGTDPSFNHCRIYSYAIGSRKLSANEQFFLGAQTAFSGEPRCNASFSPPLSRRNWRLTGYILAAVLLSSLLRDVSEIPTFSPVGSLSSNGLRMCVCVRVLVYSTCIVRNELICGHANVVYISVHTHTHARTHARTAAHTSTHTRTHTRTLTHTCSYHLRTANRRG